MRAVLFGLVGFVLAVGGAEAKGCPIDRAVLTAKDTGFRYAGITQLERPELVGQTFKVTRYVERRERHFSKPIGAMKLLGYEAYELKGDSGMFVIKREYVDGVPAVTPLSYPETGASASPPVAWSSSTKRPRVEVGQEVDYILSGAMSALTLQVAACR